MSRITRTRPSWELSCRCTQPARGQSSALAKLMVGPSRRSHSCSSRWSGGSCVLEPADHFYQPLTLNVSLSRSATSLPTFPEAPMTVTVLPGASALLPER